MIRLRRAAITVYVTYDETFQDAFDIIRDIETPLRSAFGRDNVEVLLEYVKEGSE